ncbi:MAG: serine hydrolase domain-containing protein [Solirubrobacteraceae bacterium]
MSVDACIDNVEAALAPHVESRSVPGYVAAVSLAGDRRIVAGGVMSFEPSAPAMTERTLFRIASLSKLVAGVLALSLERDGVIALDEPVERWLPELGAPRVIRDMSGPVEDTVPAERPIRVRDLLTMTSGVGLVTAPGPLQRTMSAEGLAPGPFPPPFSHDEFMRRVAALPLALQPAVGWLYHTGTDVLSVLLARAAARPLSELVAERIAAPLGIEEMGFYAREPARLATAYTPTDAGLDVLDAPSGRFSRPPRFEALGSGFVCSAPDFLAFMEMLARGGDGVLSAEAVGRMRADQLTERQRATAQLFLGEGRSWGLSCEVNLSSADTAVPSGGFGWNGGTGTTAYVDPERELAGVLLTQRSMTSNRPMPAFIDFWDAVYRGL